MPGGVGHHRIRLEPGVSPNRNARFFVGVSKDKSKKTHIRPQSDVLLPCFSCCSLLPLYHSSCNNTISSSMAARMLFRISRIEASIM